MSYRAGAVEGSGVLESEPFGLSGLDTQEIIYKLGYLDGEKSGFLKALQFVAERCGEEVLKGDLYGE
jgi:hypothetical protein